MVGGPSIIFCQYHESGKFQIGSHQYINAKISYARVIGFNASSFYLNCSRQQMPCGKQGYVEIDQPNDTEESCNQVMNKELFLFLQVDIHVANELIDKFSEFCPLFVVDSIPDKLIPSHMKE